MNVFLHSPATAPVPAHGPGDLNGIGTGTTIVVSGPPVRDRDFGFWAPALGAAVLRGASVRRVQA